MKDLQLQDKHDDVLEYKFGGRPREWIKMSIYQFPLSGNALSLDDGEGGIGGYLAEFCLNFIPVDLS